MKFDIEFDPLISEDGEFVSSCKKKELNTAEYVYLATLCRALLSMSGFDSVDLSDRDSIRRAHSSLSDGRRAELVDKYINAYENGEPSAFEDFRSHTLWPMIKILLECDPEDPQRDMRAQTLGEMFAESVLEYYSSVIEFDMHSLNADGYSAAVEILDRVLGWR